MIVNVLIDVLRQLDHVIVQFTDKEYGQALPLFDQSSIGKHTRHLLEFVQCLTSAVEEEDCIVCYDNRNRSLALESSCEASRACIEAQIEKLRNLPLDKVLMSEGSYNEGSSYKIISSVERELVYNIEHAIHHMAIIKVALRAYFPEIVILDGFGKAHSTIRYEMVESSKA